MTRILCLETSGEVCSVSLATDGRVSAFAERREKNSHAAMLTTLVEEVLKASGTTLQQLHAVAVSKGPGSYTGLRVGVSSAKGFCYALGIPLISIPTLDLMVHGFSQENPNNTGLLVPMLDARRMEVYTAVYDSSLNCIEPVAARILDETSFSDQHNQPVTFFGSGAFKMENFLPAFAGARIHHGFIPSAAFMAGMAEEAFQNQQFEDTAYFEPFYLKDFVGTTARRPIKP